MKLKLKNTPEQVELVKQMGSKNLTESREAQEAFAAFLGPVIQKVLLTAGTASAIYTDAEYDEDDSPSYPLDLYYDEGVGYVTVWSQHMAGGLPTSEVTGVAEMKIATYRLDSAVSFNKRYARKSRLDIVSKALERMGQEILIKQERNAWAVILKALAEASTTPYGSSLLKHILKSDTENKFVLNDMNRMLTLIKRLNESFSGNTPAAPFSSGITELYMAPEIMEQIRAFAYNAVGNTNVDLPANIRESVYHGSGMAEIYGVNLVEMIEFGDGKKYNTLFDSFTSGQSVPGHDSDVWDDAGGGTTDQILVGLDNTRGSFIRAVSRGTESGGGTFTALPDDQFAGYGQRIEKVGFYGHLEEGRVCIDSRAIVGLVV